jgi:hypothetical protein
MESATGANFRKEAQPVLALLFFGTMAAATYFMATASIPIVPFEIPFGLVRVLPLQYWILLMATILLLTASVASRNVSYLWVSAIMLTLIMPGLSDLINPYPRDAFATIATQYIAMTGAFSPANHVYLNFPGSEILFSSLVIVTGASPTTVLRAYGLFYNLFLLGVCYASFRRFGVTQIAAILGSLAFVLSFYMQGVLIYSSLNGFLFYVLIASVILMPYANRTTNAILLTLFFSAMVVAHAFSPILTVAGVIGVLLGWRIASIIIARTGLHFSADPPRVNPIILVAFLLILAAYWAYFAFMPFSWGLVGLTSVRFFSLFEAVGAPLIAPRTVYEMNYASITRLYAPILFLAFAIYFLVVPDRRKLQMLLLTLGLVGAVFIAVAGYVQEFLPRIFAFAIFPLNYGVARLFESHRRILRAAAVITLIVVLGLHLPAHFGQDAVYVFPNSSVQGIQFLAQHSYSNCTYNSTDSYFMNHYSFDVYRSNMSNQGPGSYYVLSYPAANLAIYKEGKTYQELTLRVSSSEYNSVYSNGLFEVYLMT